MFFICLNYRHGLDILFSETPPMKCFDVTGHVLRHKTKNSSRHYDFISMLNKTVAFEYVIKNLKIFLI